MTNDVVELARYLREKSNMGVVERFGIYRAAGSPVTHNMGDVVLWGVSKEMWIRFYGLSLTAMLTSGKWCMASLK